MLYMLYKISNIEEDSNNSSNIFSTILSNTNYTDENTEQPMEVDDYPNTRQKENKAGQYQFLKHLRYRSKEISEEVLCKDMLYVFQGIDGQFISFSLLEDAFVLEPSVNVSSSTRKLVTEM